jgi:hypothetical protein
VSATIPPSDQYPDPSPEEWAGEPLLAMPHAVAAPLAPGHIASHDPKAQGQLGGGEKVPRPQKQRAPRATRIAGDPLAAASEAIDPTAGGRAPPPAPPPPPAMPFPTGTDSFSVVPPDIAGAVSPSHLFTALNDNIHIHTRAGALVSTQPLDVFWGTQGCFDPRIVFDEARGRFYFVTMAGAASDTSSLLLAVSDTADPTGNWTIQQIGVDPAAQGPVWMDYPMLGFSGDKVTVQVNLFTLAANRFAGSTIYVFEKSALLNAQPTQLQRFVLRNKGAGHAPAITYDANVTDQYLVASWGGQAANGNGALAIWTITGSPAAGNTLLSGPQFVAGTRPWASFPPAGDFAPQLGTQTNVDSGDDRIQSVVMSGGRLHCCHGIVLPAAGANRMAVQWWSISLAPAAATTGVLDDPTARLFHAYPSLSVNNAGDMLIGHAQFSATTHPSGAYHLARAGGTSQTIVFAPGLGTYARVAGGRNRWGDYTATQVEPGGNGAFWTFQQYAAGNNAWGVMAVRIP